MSASAPKVARPITFSPDEATELLSTLKWAQFLADSLATLRGNTEAVKVSRLCSAQSRLIAQKAGTYE